MQMNDGCLEPNTFVHHSYTSTWNMLTLQSVERQHNAVNLKKAEIDSSEMRRNRCSNVFASGRKGLDILVEVFLILSSHSVRCVPSRWHWNESLIFHQTYPTHARKQLLVAQCSAGVLKIAKLHCRSIAWIVDWFSVVECLCVLWLVSPATPINKTCNNKKLNSTMLGARGSGSIVRYVVHTIVRRHRAHLPLTQQFFFPSDSLSCAKRSEFARFTQDYVCNK